MDVPSDTVPVKSPRHWFYGAAMLLMLLGVAVAFVQKGRESAVARTAAKQIASGVQRTEADHEAVQQIIRDAERWEMAGFAAVFSALVSWAVAVSRREKPRGGGAALVSLLALYVGLQLLMV